MAEPLATTLRPQTLDGVIGQEHLTCEADGETLYEMIPKGAMIR